LVAVDETREGGQVVGDNHDKTLPTHAKKARKEQIKDTKLGVNRGWIGGGEKIRNGMTEEEREYSDNNEENPPGSGGTRNKTYLSRIGRVANKESRVSSTTTHKIANRAILSEKGYGRVNMQILRKTSWGAWRKSYDGRVREGRQSGFEEVSYYQNRGQTSLQKSLTFKGKSGQKAKE